MGQGAKRIAFAGMAAIAALGLSDDARAANGAYAVDAADIAEAGSCKVESWLSGGDQHRFHRRRQPILRGQYVQAGGTEPADRPVAQRRRVEQHAGAEGQDQYRAHRYRQIGVAFYAGGSFDAMTGENLTAFAVVPATYRLYETMRINLNGGWLWDRTIDRHYLTYGLGFDWKLTDILQWTIETFGQAGTSDTPSVVRPRFQTGMRYRPNDIFSVDVIYGRNISGENANWITIGTTIRFPVPGSKPDHHRTGHL